MNNLKPFLYLIILLFFNNCGYTPVYSKKNNEDLIAISVKNIKNRPGQILRNSLMNKINPENKRVITKYRLTIEISESQSNLAYRQDMSATRTDLEIDAKYILTNIKNGNILIDSSTKSISSFDVVESVYATIIAEKDAREKSLQDISDQIYTTLIIFFKNN